MAYEVLQGNPITSYNLQVETKLQIDEMIYSYSPMDLPLTTGVGADGNAILTKQPVLNTQFWWLEDKIPLPRAVCSAAMLATGDVTVATTDAIKFAVGDSIRIENEIVKVTAINTGTGVLTLTRGQYGTTAATHVISSDMIGLGTILPEGSIGDGNYGGRDKKSNYTQIFSGKVQATRTEQIIPKYGVPNEFTKQIANRVQHLMLGIENAALYGIAYNDSASKTRATGGLNAYITQANATAPWLTVAEIEKAQQVVYNNGGSLEIVLAAPAAFQALNNIMGNDRVQTVTVDDQRRGRQRAMVVNTEYGTAELVRDRWIGAKQAFLYTKENFRMRVMRPLLMEKLARTDDTDSFSIVTELGFQVSGADHMYKFSNLDLAAALPTGQG